MRAEFGVDSMMMRGSRSGWKRSDVLFSFGGVIIAGTAPGVLFSFFADGKVASLEVCKDL